MNDDNKKIIVERIMAELLEEIKKYDEAVAKQRDHYELKLILDKKDRLLKQLTTLYLKKDGEE